MYTIKDYKNYYKNEQQKKDLLLNEDIDNKAKSMSPDSHNNDSFVTNNNKGDIQYCIGSLKQCLNYLEKSEKEDKNILMQNDISSIKYHLNFISKILKEKLEN